MGGQVVDGSKMKEVNKRSSKTIDIVSYALKVSVIRRLKVCKLA